MNVVKKEWKQFIPRPLDEVWHFFSRPENLENLTPEDMKFEILSNIQGVEMYEGMLVQYKVTPMLGIKLNWVTEITHIKKGKYFIDEQRFGPYAMWHHEHHFEEVEGGVNMIDKLYYKIPFGPIGSLANAIFVENRVQEIFDFRYEKVEKLFQASGQKVR